MAKQTVEEVVQELQKTVEAQAKEIRRLQRADDTREIQNLMGRYEAWHIVGMHDDVLELFAKNAPDASIDIPMWGRWEGFEGVKKCWEAHKYYEGDRVGHLHVNVNGTPVIEVAEDGRTGKGMWTTIGVATIPSEAEGKPIALWSLKRYTMDFIKEDGKWKIWHFRVCPIFGTRFDKSWVDESLSHSKPIIQVSEEHQAPMPCTPIHEYDARGVFPYDPAVPTPYKTWDKSMSY